MAALGFVSVGLRPPTAELGLMMIELLPYYHEAPWAMAQPIFVLFVVVIWWVRGRGVTGAGA